MRISDWSSDVCSSDLRCVERLLQDDDLRQLLVDIDAGNALGAELQGLQEPFVEFEGRSRRRGQGRQIGRESCRERVVQYVSNSVVGVALYKKTKQYNKKSK